MRLNSSRAGALRLGALIQEALDAQEPPWKRDLLIKKLAEVGHETNMWTVSRLINGQTEKLDASLLLAIALLKLLINPATRQAYTLEELVLISCEALIPVKATDAPKTPYPAAVAEIRNRMGDRDLRQFARLTGISEKRLNEILMSPEPGKALPSWKELMQLAGVIYPDKSVEPLIRLYGYGSKALSNGQSNL